MARWWRGALAAAAVASGQGGGGCGGSADRGGAGWSAQLRRGRQGDAGSWQPHEEEGGRGGGLGVGWARAA